MFTIMEEHDVSFSRRNHCPSARDLHYAVDAVKSPWCAQAGFSHGAVQVNAISLALVMSFLQETHC